MAKFELSQVDWGCDSMKMKLFLLLLVIGVGVIGYYTLPSALVPTDELTPGAAVSENSAEVPSLIALDG